MCNKEEIDQVSIQEGQSSAVQAVQAPETPQTDALFLLGEELSDMSFEQKVQKTLQEIALIKEQNQLTEEKALQVLAPLTMESVKQLNLYEITNEELISEFGSLNDPRIALIGVMLAELEKESNDTDISVSSMNKVLGCLGHATGISAIRNVLELLGEKNIEKIGKKAFKKIAKNVLKRVGSKFFGPVGIVVFIADFSICMSSSYLAPKDPKNNIIVGIDDHLLKVYLKDDLGKRRPYYILDSSVNYSYKDKSYTIVDSQIYATYEYVKIVIEPNHLVYPPIEKREVIEGYEKGRNILGSQINKDDVEPISEMMSLLLGPGSQILPKL